MTDDTAAFAIKGNGGDGILMGQRATTPYAAWIAAGYLPNIGTSHNYPLTLQPHGGNVGIGTTDPTTPLEVHGGASMSGGWGRTATLAHNFPVLVFQSKYSTDAFAGIGYDNSTGMKFWVNSSTSDLTGNSQKPALTILDNKQIGIGTENPSGRLTIANPTAYAPNTITTANTYLQLGSSDYGSGGSSNNDGKFMIGFGYTGGVSNTNSPAYIGFEETSTSSATKGDLTFYTRPAASDTAPTERMRIHDSGNVSLATGMTYGNKWHEVVFGGTGSGPTAITVQVDIAAKTTGQIFKVEAIFNHWNSDASNYTVAKKVKYFWTYSSTTSIVEHVDGVADRGGSSVGAWTVDKPSNTRLRVTKSAGANNWPGEWYVRITSSCPITKV
jgi:hypothetical protein